MGEMKCFAPTLFHIPNTVSVVVVFIPDTRVVMTAVNNIVDLRTVIVVVDFC
jgi:hypothetical protein